MDYKRAVEFLKNIKSRDNVIIIYNNDADGICSCILIKKLLEKTAKAVPYIISQPMPTEKNLIRKIQTTLPTKIVFLDLAIDQQQDVLKKLVRLCDILIIDHHQITKDANSPDVVHCNPRFNNPKIYQSATYLAYKICEEITDMSEHLWIAAVGMIGDYNLDDSQDLVNQVREKCEIKEGKLYDSFLGRIADMISSARATRELTCEQMVEILGKAKSPEDFQKTEGSEKMVEAYKAVENEFVAIEHDAEANTESIGNLVLYNLKSKFTLGSAVSTRLSEKYTKKMLVIYSKEKGKIHISARNQKGAFNVAKILQKAAQGLNASAGGHDRAAGATVDEKDWEIFRERLIELVK